MPVALRTVNDYGITIDNRTYDCKALNPYRRKASGLPGGNRTKWEVHYDPYDITLVWLRDHGIDEWITVPWVYRSLAGQPFGLALWDHVRRMTTERTGPRPSEAEIARNVADLLARAHGQDVSREDSRAIAIEANRPAHPKLPAVEEPDLLAPRGDEAADEAEPPAGTESGGYKVFDPDGVTWRL